MLLTLSDIHLPMRHPFTIALGTTLTKHNLIVKLEENGLVGYGEGASSRAWLAFTPASMRADLERVRGEIEGSQFSHPAEFWAKMQPLLGHNPFALCALDQAAHDLWGQRENKPVWNLWGLDVSHTPVSNYTIGLDSLENMVAKMQEFPGWPIYKIKLGTGTDRDLEIVRALRQHTDAIFRIDANTGWTVEQTLAYAPELRKLGVEFLEQPLPRDDWEGQKRLHEQCELPIIADESCLAEADVARCAGHFAGINIKLTKAGGLTPALRMIEQARSLGLKVMVGCMCETSIGISAIAQLLPLLDYVDMDGALLITQDPADGVRLDHGRAIYPDRPGLGLLMNKDILHVPAAKAAAERQQLGPYGIESLIPRDAEAALTAYRVVISPHSTTAESYHKIAEELYYVLAGRGTAVLNGQPQELATGDFLRLPPGTTHGFITQEDSLIMLDIHTPGSRPDRDVYFVGERPDGFGCLPGR